MRKTSSFTIGRFQVTPSKDTTAVHHNEPRPLSQVAPTAHSPPPFRLDQSESSTETQSESESSNSTVTVPTPGHPPGYYDNPGAEEGEGRKRRDEEERKRRAGQRLSLWEGSGSSPMNGSSRSTLFFSSDESESENEEMWVELQELRER